ncbi:hypothetical protein NX059_004793 [Plenodomus lindquistii]|nr:hypothetical protein NX059_004793 [Plenodomus lindquistii]
MDFRVICVNILGVYHPTNNVAIGRPVFDVRIDAKREQKRITELEVITQSFRRDAEPFDQDLSADEAEPVTKALIVQTSSGRDHSRMGTLDKD